MQKILLSFLFLVLFSSISYADFRTRDYSDTPLTQAVVENDYERAKKLLDKNPDLVDERESYMYAPPLLFAVENNNLKIAELLLENGANPDASYDFEGGPTIIMSARADMAELLISYGAEIDYYAVEGENPFGAAVRRGDVDAMKVFLKHGVKPDVSSIMDEGSANCDYALACFIQGAESAFYYGASEYSLIEVLKLLIELGADIHANIEHYNNPSQSLLMYMAESNSVQIMKFLLDNGVDINAKDFEGKTALDYALREGNNRAADFLLERNAKVSVHDDVLIPLAEDGNIERIQFFLDKGADINAKDKDGNTALHSAAHYGRIDTIKFLLDKGANVSARNNDNDTPIIRICYGLSKVKESNLLECLDILLKAGADINAQGNSGFTVLINMMQLKVYKEDFDEYAVPSLKAMQFLIDNGADINLKNAKAYNIFFFSLEYAGYVYKGRILPNEVIEFFFKNGLDKNAVDNEGHTALHLALKEHKQETIQLLLDNGFDINSLNYHNQSPLMTATGLKTDMINFLVKKGAKVNLQDKNGVSALMSAAYYFNTERVEALLKNGADIHVKDNDGNKALSYTRYSDFVNVPIFVKYKANINEKNAEGRTLLMDAQSFNIEKLLSIKGINLEVKDETGTTALIMALDPNKVEDLLNAGAKVNAANDDGITALMICAYYDVYDSVELLLKHNAKVNIQDSDGMTALSYAEIQENTRIIELLKRHGAE